MDNLDSYSHQNARVRHATPFHCSSSFHKEEFLRNYTLASNTVVDDVVVHREFHRHIVGRNTATVARIEKETSTTVYFPSHVKRTGVPLPSNVIRIHGRPAGVAAAKQAILEIAAKAGHDPVKERMIKETVNIHPGVQGKLIGYKGRNIIQLQSRFRVHVNFSDLVSEKHLVTIRGRKENVEKAKCALLSLAHYCMQLDAVKVQRFVQSLSDSGPFKGHTSSGS